MTTMMTEESNTTAQAIATETSVDVCWAGMINILLPVNELLLKDAKSGRC